VTFQAYDDEFASLVQQIETSLNGDLEEQADGSNSSQYTSNLLQQCDDLVKQMGLEARSTSSSQLKRQLLDAVKKHKSQLQSLQSEYERQSLMGGSGNSRHSNSSHQQHERLLRTENQLSNQNETLERARRTMQETEAVALEITEELGHNRSKLESSHSRIREVSGLTGRARRILQSMNQRATQQKLILYGVAVGLVLGFIVLLYTMWR